MKNRIKELRKAKGLTQPELAELVETSVGQIARLESGLRRLDTDWMERIAPHLGVRPAELIEDRTHIPHSAKLSPYVDQEVFNESIRAANMTVFLYNRKDVLADPRSYAKLVLEIYNYAMYHDGKVEMDETIVNEVIRLLQATPKKSVDI